jgi:LCP family protein required for cell wall assembly
VAVAGAGLAATLWFASRGRVYLLMTLVQPRWLWVLFGVNLAVLLLRVAAVADAYALERRLRPGPQPGRGWPARLLLVLLIAAVVVPHAVLADYSLTAIDTLHAVFAQGELPSLEEREQALLSLGLSEEDLGPTTTLAPTILTNVGPHWAIEHWLPESDLNPVEPVIVPREANSYDAPFPSVEENLDKDRLTVLLAGGDAGPGRWSMRTDVMIVATMNLATGKVVLFSVSRDMVNAPLPAGWANSFVDMEYQQVVEQAQAQGVDPPPRESFQGCKCFPDRINGIWTFTNTWVRTFPDAMDPGMEALRQTLSLLLGIHIDYYVLVDMAGFVDLVDALGGIDLYVTETMDVAFSPAREGENPVAVTVLEPGNYHFDGHQALAFVRNRTNTNDAARMRRQRCTIRALAAETEPVTLALRFPQIAQAVRDSTVTNIPLSFLPDLIQYAADLNYSDIATVVFGYPYYAPELNYRNLPIVDPDRIRAKVQSAIAAVETAEGAARLAETCEVLPAR